MIKKQNILIILLIPFLLISIFLTKKYFEYYNFKNRGNEYSNLADMFWIAYGNYYSQFYKEPTDINVFLNYVKTYSGPDTLTIDMPDLIKRNGLFIDCDKKNNVFGIYTTNTKNIDKFSDNKYYDIDDINFYTFLFKKIKIHIFWMSPMYNLCDINKKSMNLIYKNKRIPNDNNLYYRVYHKVGQLKFKDKKFLSTKVYLYGIKRNNKFMFSIKCGNDSADYTDILLKSDSIFNLSEFKDSIDEMYIPIRDVAIN